MNYESICIYLYVAGVALTGVSMIEYWHKVAKHTTLVKFWCVIFCIAWPLTVIPTIFALIIAAGMGPKNEN